MKNALYISKEKKTKTSDSFQSEIRSAENFMHVRDKKICTFQSDLRTVLNCFKNKQTKIQLIGEKKSLDIS